MLKTRDSRNHNNFLMSESFCEMDTMNIRHFEYYCTWYWFCLRLFCQSVFVKNKCHRMTHRLTCNPISSSLGKWVKTTTLLPNALFCNRYAKIERVKILDCVGDADSMLLVFMRIWLQHFSFSEPKLLEGSIVLVFDNRMDRCLLFSQDAYIGIILVFLSTIVYDSLILIPLFASSSLTLIRTSMVALKETLEMLLVSAKWITTFTNNFICFIYQHAFVTQSTWCFYSKSKQCVVIRFHSG